MAQPPFQDQTELRRIRNMDRLESDLWACGLNWKDICQVVAKIHRDKYPAESCTSEDFYKPKK